MSEVYTCPTCGHEETAYWRTLNAGNVRALIKFRRAIGYHGRNEIHLYKDMDGHDFKLTTAEQMNWTKLRFHGLVAKVKEDGQIKRGYWLLTARGAAFLRGDLDVPRKVKTLNNRVIEHDDVYVSVDQVAGSRPVFDDLWDMQRERQPLELQQVPLL